MSIKTEIIVFSAIAIFFIYKIIKHKSGDNIKRPAADLKPTVKKQNDKIVVVKGISLDNIKKALVDVCNMYNNERFDVLPRLTKISENEFVVTFPFDMTFEMFCFFVNYLTYPIGIEPKPIVLSWTSTKKDDSWVEENAMNKKVMLFIPDDDTEGDNVYMTTEYNTGYKIDFGGNNNLKPLLTPKKRYESPAIDILDLEGKPFEDFQ